MKKVIVVTYYWPPSGGSGVQRWMYFCKHLKENGIEPIVVTIDPKDAAYPAIDESLLKHTEGIRVIHTSGGFQLIKLYSFLKTGSSNKEIPVGNFGSERKTRMDKFAGYIRANLFIPDARVGWNKKVIPVVRKLIAEEKIDTIITTGPPHSTHLVGLQVKKATRIRWFADFRDPWVDIYYNKIFRKTARSERKDQFLEAEVLQNADKIITVGPTLGRLLIKNIDESKIEVIHNGFDEGSFAGIEPKRYDEITICHVGVWTVLQPYAIVANALKRILEEHPSLKLRFLIVGKAADEIEQSFTGIERLTLDLRGKVSHKEALTEMKNVDILLNCLPIQENAELIVSGKLMEYLASGNKVLALGKTNGDAARVIAKAPNASIVAEDDEEGVYNALSEKIFSERLKTLEVPVEIQPFSRKQTAVKLAALINS